MINVGQALVNNGPDPLFLAIPRQNQWDLL